MKNMKETQQENMQEEGNENKSHLAELLSSLPDMEFVKNFTHPDFQAKSFTPQKCVICDIFLAN